MSALSEAKTVLLEEMGRGSSRLTYRITALSAPVLLVALLVAMPLVRGVFFDDDDDAAAPSGQDVGIVDLAGVLSGDGAASVGVKVYGDREAGMAALAAGEVEDLFVVAEDYMASGRVDWLYTGSVFDVPEMDAGDLIAALLREALVAGRLSPDAETRFLSPLVISPPAGSSADAAEDDGDGGAPWVSYAFAIVLMVSVMMGGGLLLESVSEEKENRMVEIILTSVSPLGVMVGKVMGQGLLALGQLALWLGSLAVIGPRVFDQIPDLGELSIEPSLIAWLVVFFLAGYFVVAVLMAAFGAMASSYTQSSQILAIVIIPVAIPQFILDNPDGTLARVLSLFPITAPTTIAMRIGQTDVPLPELLLSLGVILVSGVVLLYASARIFRAGMLLYGQRMSVGGVLRALRQG